MASTMRSLARIPKSDVVEQKQEKLNTPAQPEPLLEPVVVPDIAVPDVSPIVSEPFASEIVTTEPEAIVENFESPEVLPPAEPVAESVEEPAQPKPPAEKKTKPKPPAKKPKAADQKKVNSPLPETET